MRKILQKLKQEHILSLLETLPSEKKQALLEQLSLLDPRLVEQQNKDFISSQASFANDDFSSFVRRAEPLHKEDCFVAQEEDEKIGEKLLKKKKVALVLLAGGQATRLGYSLPKGCFPISAIEKKSLFQIVSEKILAAQKKYGVEFLLACMLSSLNEKPTIEFFRKNHYFGLKKKNILFFTQSLLPILDEKGKWIYGPEGLSLAPDGNGDLFYHLEKNAILQKFAQEKIKILSVFSIDNPLLNPLEASLLANHERLQNDVTIRCIPKEKNMGLLASCDGKIQILEYLYFSKNSLNEKKFLYANANHFCINLSFAKKTAKKRFSLAYHFVKKQIPTKIKKTELFGYKAEKFLFDNFRFAKKSSAVLYAKKTCFSPLKSLKDVSQVQKDLMEKDRSIFFKLTGRKISSTKKIELSFAFHFPQKDLQKKCQNLTKLPSGYIDQSDLV